MADHAAAGQHPVRGDDHVRPRRLGDRLRGLHVVRDGLVRVVERRRAVAEQLRGLLVVVVGVVAVDVGRLRGHRRVEEQREQRDLAALDEPVQLPDDLLRPPDGERRDQQHALRLVDHPDRLGEDADRLVGGLVFAAAVGGLDEHVVRAGLGVGSRRIGVPGRPRSPEQTMTRSSPPGVSVTVSRMIAEPRMWPASSKTALTPGPPRAPGRTRWGGSWRASAPRHARCRAGHRGRRGDAAAGRGGPPRGRSATRPGPSGRACGLDGRLDVFAGRGGTTARRSATAADVVAAGARHGRVPEDPVLAVGGEGHGGLVGRLLLAVLGRGLVGVALLPAHAALGELLVELARVEQDQRRELDRAGRRVDRAAIAGLDQVRDQPAVVEVGMGQEDAVERRRVEVEREPVPDRLVRAPLEHPAVDEHLGLPGDEQVLRAGDGRRATEEVDLHRAHGDREPRRTRTRLGRCGGSWLRW